MIPPNADRWFDAIAARIIEMLENRTLEDAEHFFTLTLSGCTEITARIPDAILSSQIDQLLAEQADDGGWPTPYDEVWRPWMTAGNMMTLATLAGEPTLH